MDSNFECLLAKKFDSNISRYFKKPRKSLGKVPENSKNYKYFSELSKIFVEFPYINQDLYIEAQVYWAYNNKQHCNPSWLVTENSLRRYLEFIETRSSLPVQRVDFKEQVLESIKQSISFAFSKSLELGINISDLFEFKKPTSIIPECYIWILNGSLSKAYLSISKSYYKFYKSVDVDIKGDFPDIENLEKMRRLIILNKDLHRFCKSIIPTECNF